MCLPGDDEVPDAEVYQSIRKGHENAAGFVVFQTLLLGQLIVTPSFSCLGVLTLHVFFVIPHAPAGLMCRDVGREGPATRGGTCTTVLTAACNKITFGKSPVGTWVMVVMVMVLNSACTGPPLPRYL